MSQPRETRPDILKIAKDAELKRWYWLKDELTSAARHHRLKTSGGKFEILARIGHFLETGETNAPGDKPRKSASKFDWHRESLTPDTIITDSYKNSQNVRRFFMSHTGDNFKFNIALMEWIKSNTGKTLADALTQYHQLQGDAAQSGYQTAIKSHNQFNQYTRDFLDNNPDLGMADVRRIWALKRALPSPDGRHTYDASDLHLKG